MRKILLIFSLSLFFNPLILASDSGNSDSVFAVQISPGSDIPLGDSAVYFSPGILVGANVLFTPTKLSPFIFGGGFEFVRNARDEEQKLTKLSLSGGGGISFPLLPWLALNCIVKVGYSYCLMDTDADPVGAGIPVTTLSVGPSFYILPSLSLDLSASYQGYLGLSNSIGLTLGATYHFPKKLESTGPPILKGIPPKLINLEFDTIFPIFYKYYDDHPIGSAVLINPREEEVTDFTLDIFIRQCMDTPKRCTLPDSLLPEETVTVNLDALLNNSVLEITEGTKVAAELTLSYRVDGIKYSDVISETVRVHYRNAMTWDDDRRAAAFVTAKDPVVMGFSKKVSSMLNGIKSQAINRNLQTGIAIHNALSLYGLTYVIDPNTSYADFSKQKTAVDYLQFPRETLEYKAGDCDDLSILYCALFEAVGIESAFVTIPGHIFIAFSLGISPEEAEKAFYVPDNLIFIDDKAWVPLEVTAVEQTFLKAWESGAREWRENNTKNLTGFFPLSSAWQQYEPVGLPGEGIELIMPSDQEVIDLFLSEISSFIASEINPQAASLKAKIESTQGGIKYLNKLGVLYARYGLTNEAIIQFNRILAEREYFPALINMGNIYFLANETGKALEFYERGYAVNPDNLLVVLCKARTNHVLGNYETAGEQYNRVKNLNPELAERFTYLESKTESSERAADINKSEAVIVWQEE